MSLWQSDPYRPIPAVWSSKSGTKYVVIKLKKILFRAYFQCRKEECKEYFINFAREYMTNFPDLFEEVHKEIQARHQELQQIKRFKSM